MYEKVPKDLTDLQFISYKNNSLLLTISARRRRDWYKLSTLTKCVQPPSRTRRRFNILYT